LVSGISGFITAFHVRIGFEPAHAANQALIGERRRDHALRAEQPSRLHGHSPDRPRRTSPQTLPSRTGARVMV
jgi:hypothetical protein